ncbi:MAG: RdgB/HAM1 family non-canonical purine NTP pyrophosphatase [Candidatus Latescibacterota bacterium]
MTPLLVATRNSGKMREIRALLADLAIVSAEDLGLELRVAETGPSFSHNAELKARAHAQAAGLPALADDSGLEVDALDGAPGVLSARYGGPGLTDADRCGLLLRRLAGEADPRRRTARFRCCAVARSPDGRGCQAEGVCEGVIAIRPAGSGGFGYDPIFHLPEQGCTMAQLAPQVKNRISHRARALLALRPLLLQTFPELSAG